MTIEEWVAHCAASAEILARRMEALTEDDPPESAREVAADGLVLAADNYAKMGEFAAAGATSVEHTTADALRELKRAAEHYVAMSLYVRACDIEEAEPLAAAALDHARDLLLDEGEDDPPDSN